MGHRFLASVRERHWLTAILRSRRLTWRTSSSQYRKKGIFQADRIIVPHIWRIGPVKDQLEEKPE
jgi:hypothetical protein